METHTDLNDARAAWLADLTARQSFSADQLRELEAHLDDAMDDLSARGLSREEAFLIGTRRLGAPESLASEFRKVGAGGVWSLRAGWMLLGVVAYLVTGALSQILTDFVSLAAGFLPRGWIRTLTFPVLAVAATLSCIWLLQRCVCGSFRWPLPDWAKRSPGVAVVLLLLAAFAASTGMNLFSSHLAIETMAKDEFHEQILMGRWIGLGSTLIWLGAVAVLFRRHGRLVLPAGS